MKKYIKGEKITSLTEIATADFIIVRDKTYHKGWFQSWRLRDLLRLINSGNVYEAIPLKNRISLECFFKFIDELCENARCHVKGRYETDYSVLLSMITELYDFIDPLLINKESMNEINDKFATVRYWLYETDRDFNEKIDGVVFSVLTAIDGDGAFVNDYDYTPTRLNIDLGDDSPSYFEYHSAWCAWCREKEEKIC